MNLLSYLSILWIDLFAERRTKAKHAEVLQTPVQTSDPQAAKPKSKLTFSTRTIEAHTPVIPLGGILQDLTAPIRHVIAQALVSESIKASIPAHTGSAAEFPTSMTKDPLQEPTSESEAASEQHTAGSPVTKAKQAIPEEPLIIGVDKSSEANIPAQSEVDISIQKDDRSLFPEITPSLSTVKNTNQPEMVLEGAGPDPVSSIITSRIEVL